MEPEIMRSLINQAKDAWIAGDADAFATLFVPNGEFIVPGHRWVGQVAIRQAVADFVSTHSEVKIDIRRIAIDGAVAVVEWSWEDKENGTERRSQADDAIVIDFTVAGISRWREYIDTQTPAKLQETKESLGTSRD